MVNCSIIWQFCCTIDFISSHIAKFFQIWPTVTGYDEYYALDFSESEMAKYFEWIISNIIPNLTCVEKQKVSYMICTPYKQHKNVLHTYGSCQVSQLSSIPWLLWVAFFSISVLFWLQGKPPPPLIVGNLDCGESKTSPTSRSPTENQYTEG